MAGTKHTVARMPRLEPKEAWPRFVCSPRRRPPLQVSPESPAPGEEIQILELGRTKQVLTQEDVHGLCRAQGSSNDIQVCKDPKNYEEQNTNAWS